MPSRPRSHRPASRVLACWLLVLGLALPGADAGGLELADDGVTGAPGIALTLDEDGLPADVVRQFPHLAGFSALVLPEAALDQVDALLSGQLAVASHRNDRLVDATGVWSLVGEPDWRWQYYLFELEVYVHDTGRIERNLVTDPYSLSLAMNSARSQIVDLRDPALAPPGWTELVKPPLADPVDAVIDELHVRDFSAADPLVPEALVGTYLAFTLEDSYALRHLRRLAHAGLAHLHLLPTFDIATIDEDRSTWLEPEIDEPLPSASPRPQAAGQSPRTVLDRVVPGCYHRLDPSGNVTTSTCCPNTATEHAMMERLMLDSVALWAEHYKVDAFRFDLMGHHMARNMHAVHGDGPFDGGTALVANQGFATGAYVLPNEETARWSDEARRAAALLAADQVRVGLAGNLEHVPLVDHTGALVLGRDVDYNGQPAGYARVPQDHVVYLSKHDNQTLWDIAQYKLPSGLPTDDRVRLHTLALSTVLFSQGVPFVHAGSELLRSKSFDRNSYDSGDWFNAIDWTMQTNGMGRGLPKAGYNRDTWGLMRERLVDPLLRLRSAEDVLARLRFHDTGPDQTPGVIVLSLHDDVDGLPSLDPGIERMAIAWNAGPRAVSVAAPDLAGMPYLVHEVQAAGVDAEHLHGAYVLTASGRVRVPAFSTVVFVAQVLP